MEHTSDVGIGQSIICNKNADDPDWVFNNYKCPHVYPEALVPI
jgi:hypothetical protein